MANHILDIWLEGEAPTLADFLPRFASFFTGYQRESEEWYSNLARQQEHLKSAEERVMKVEQELDRLEELNEKAWREETEKRNKSALLYRDKELEVCKKDLTRYVQMIDEVESWRPESAEVEKMRRHLLLMLEQRRENALSSQEYLATIKEATVREHREEALQRAKTEVARERQRLVTELDLQKKSQSFADDLYKEVERLRKERE